MMEVLLVDRAGTSGKEDPEDSLLASMWRGACESTPASRNAPIIAVCNQGKLSLTSVSDAIKFA